MTIQRFEDLHVPRRDQDLAVVLYEDLAGCKDYKSKDQITAACVSISNYIAEGFEQPSTINYVRFIHIARNSSNEVRSMSYLTERLTYLNGKQCLHIRSECEAISKMLRSMAEKLMTNVRARTTKK